MKTPAQLLLGRRISEVVDDGIFKGVSIPVPELIGDESYVELPAYGLSMVLPDGQVISAVQLHGEGHDGYSKFSGALPELTRFEMSRTDVRECLGVPEQSGDGCIVPVLGHRPAWDCFVKEGQRLHFEYADDGASIRLVTIS